MNSMVFYFTIVIIILFWIFKKIGNKSLGEQGIAHPKPWPVFGNVFYILIQRKSFAVFLEEIYIKFSNKKIFGFYSLFGTYTLVLSDPSLIKQVTVKDFNHFVNRDPGDQNDTDKLLSKSILELRDQRWRDMRLSLSPIFTGSKLKLMFGLLTDCVNDFVSFYEEKALRTNGEVVIETHDVFARVTASSIATTTLGLQGDCVRNEKSIIYEIADAIEKDFTNPTTALLINTFPSMFKLLGKQIFRKSVHDFFETNVLQEIRRRRDLNIQRSDIIQLLMQAQDGKLKTNVADEVDGNYLKTKIHNISKWTDEDLVAQALIMFLGGFETTAATMQAVCWELSKNPDVQNTLIEEVVEMVESLEGKSISYEKLNEMKYLDMVINETLRKWPAFRITPRLCEKDCVLKTDDGRTFNIKIGDEINIPIGAIQRDPKYFKNPTKFDPLRFSDENKGNIISGTFIPFGMGPRSCIGSRYAIIEAKLLLFKLIATFEICHCDKTPENLTFSDGTLGYKETIFVSLRLRK